MTLDLGRIGIWTGAFDGQPMSAVIDAAQTIERLGFETLWVPETVGRDPFVVVTTLLANTSALRLATGIANIYARDPLTMAATQKSLAEAFPGRFLLGLGVSHHHLVERVRKHSYDRPLAYMKEYLGEMDGSLYLAVPPAEEPPRVIAALGPKMLELAASATQGAHPYLTTPEHTAQARAILGAGPVLAPEQMVVFETDPSAARSIAHANLSNYLRAPNYQNNLLRLGFTEDDWADPKQPSDHLVDALVAWGTPEQIGERIAAHHAAGADHVCVQVLRGDRALPTADWEQLAGLL
jgi:probable F420-dependent oxidoreductase